MIWHVCSKRLSYCSLKAPTRFLNSPFLLPFWCLAWFLPCLHAWMHQVAAIWLHLQVVVAGKCISQHFFIRQPREQFDIYRAFPAVIGQGTCWSVTTWTVTVCGCKAWRGLALDAAWRDAAFSGNPSPSFFSHSSFVCVACRAAVRWRWSHKHGIWPTDYSGTQWMAAKAFFLYSLQKKIAPHYRLLNLYVKITHCMRNQWAGFPQKASICPLHICL